MDSIIVLLSGFTAYSFIAFFFLILNWEDEKRDGHWVIWSIFWPVYIFKKIYSFKK